MDVLKHALRHGEDAWQAVESMLRVCCMRLEAEYLQIVFVHFDDLRAFQRFSLASHATKEYLGYGMWSEAGFYFR